MAKVEDKLEGMGIELLLQDIDVLNDEITARESQITAIERLVIAKVGVVYQQFMEGVISCHECFMEIEVACNDAKHYPTNLK